MKFSHRLAGLTTVALVAAAFAGTTLAQDKPAKAAAKPAQKSMTFFVSSTGSGKGADFGGLEGADKHCQLLADVVGEGKKTWRAYLSASATDKAKAVNARDRIGKGPWYNAKGELVAKSVDDLHDNSGINKKTALSETGKVINGRGDTPNTHDILTGSDSHGYAFPPGQDTTCGNWTKSSAEGSAMVGHHDRQGLDEKAPAKSWVMSHPSRGCSSDALRSSGGGGLVYCFAAK